MLKSQNNSCIFIFIVLVITVFNLSAQSSKVNLVDQKNDPTIDPTGFNYYSTPPYKKKWHRPPNKGLYHIFSLGVTPDWEFLNRVGADASIVSGWHFNRCIGLGLGIGLHFVSIGMEHAPFIPIYLNIRGNIMEFSSSLFYNIDIGYGISAPMSESSHIKSIYGGYYIRPAIGFRFPSKLKGHFFIDTGLSLQHTTIQFTHHRTIPNYPIYGISARFGMVF